MKLAFRGFCAILLIQLSSNIVFAQSIEITPETILTSDLARKIGIRFTSEAAKEIQFYPRNSVSGVASNWVESAYFVNGRSWSGESFVGSSDGARMMISALPNGTMACRVSAYKIDPEKKLFPDEFLKGKTSHVILSEDGTAYLAWDNNEFNGDILCVSSNGPGYVWKIADIETALKWVKIGATP